MIEESLDRWPRNREAYKVTDHFEDILEDPQRFMSDERVRRALRYGRRLPNDGDACVAFENDRFGVVYYVLAGWDEPGEERVLITGWPNLEDPVFALESGQWGHDELVEIHRFNGADEPLTDAYSDYPPDAA